MTKVYSIRDNFANIPFFLYLFYERTTKIHIKQYQTDRERDVTDARKSGYHMILCFCQRSHPDFIDPSYDHHRYWENETECIHPEKRCPVFCFRESETIIEKEYEEIPHHPESKYMTMDRTEYRISFEITSEFTIGKSDEESHDHREHRETCKDWHKKEVRK